MIEFDGRHLRDEEVHLTHLIYEVIKDYPAYIGCAAMTKLIMLALGHEVSTKAEFLDIMAKCWERIYREAA